MLVQRFGSLIDFSKNFLINLLYNMIILKKAEKEIKKKEETP